MEYEVVLNQPRSQVEIHIPITCCGPNPPSFLLSQAAFNHESICLPPPILASFFEKLRLPLETSAVISSDMEDIL